MAPDPAAAKSQLSRIPGHGITHNACVHTAHVYPYLWVCGRREGRGFKFIPQTLNVGGHREESELSGRAECWLGDWQEEREGYVGKYERV